MKAIERLYQYIDFKGYKPTNFEREIGLSSGYLSIQKKRSADIGETVLNKINDYCQDLSLDWLLTGKGEMLKAQYSEQNSDSAILAEPNPEYSKKGSKKLKSTPKIGVQFYDPENKQAERKLIPFYEDIVTVGGVNAMSADVDSTPGVSEWIDAGDWFRDATAAIRHYGDNMTEYPSGCILALKKVEDTRLLFWGKHYCIETAEYRITKQLQPGEDKNTLLAYSSNRETYPDGRLIHAPVLIPLESIRSIFLVLGCVIKEYSSGPCT